MSAHPQPYAFPQRTPVFTALVVIAAAVFCGWLINKFYEPAAPFNNRGTAKVEDFEEDQRWRATPEGRAKALQDMRQQNRTAGTTYDWVDKTKGVVRIPIERAVDLTVQQQKSRK